MRVTMRLIVVRFGPERCASRCENNGGFLGGASQLRNETGWHYAIHLA